MHIFVLYLEVSEELNPLLGGAGCVVKQCWSFQENHGDAGTMSPLWASLGRGMVLLRASVVGAGSDEDVHMLGSLSCNRVVTAALQGRRLGQEGNAAALN